MNKKDYVRWAHGLKKAGYATDPQYAYKLISLIERYELWKYDGSKAPIKSKSAEKKQKNNTDFYVVKQGDTLYSIAKQFDVSVDALMRTNKLDSTALAIGQQLKLK
jgi:LysM repeat protein